MSNQKELLIMQLVNLAEKLIFYSQPIDEWDGISFSHSLEDYPAAAEVENSPPIILSKG